MATTFGVIGSQSLALLRFAETDDWSL